MNTFVFLTANGNAIPLEDHLLPYFRQFGLSGTPEDMARVRRCAPAATESQLLAIAAFRSNTSELGSDYRFACKRQLTLSVDCNGWIRWERRSDWHPQPYVFTWAAAKDNSDSEEWVMMKTNSPVPGNLRVRSLEEAFELARLCDARISDVMCMRAKGARFQDAVVTAELSLSASGTVR